MESEKYRAEITCLTMFDLLKSGMPDIIVGRLDGNVEVYTVIQTDEVSNEFKPPLEKFSYVSLGKSIF